MIEAIQISSKWFHGEDCPKRWRVKFARAEAAVLKRKAYVRPSVWMERHLYLPGDDGRMFRVDFRDCPWMADIVDASFYKCVQEVICKAVPQWGKTTIAYGCLAYATDRVPGPALMVFPGEDDTKDELGGRAKKIFEASPRLREYLTGKEDDLSNKRIRLKHMTITGAWPTAKRLARKPIAYVVLDEEDKTTAVKIGGEAGVKRLLDDRQRRYEHIRKMWRLCSPTVEEGSISVAYAEDCHLRFELWVKCPECGHYQLFVYGRESLQWPEDIRTVKEMEQRREVWYVCAGCGARWDEEARKAAIRDGEWRDDVHGLSLWVALEAYKPLKIGFHGPSLMAPFIPMWRIAAAFLATLDGNLDALKHFKNSHEAVAWVIKQRVRKVDRILALRDERPRGRVPGGGEVAMLTGYADTQDDGFWFQVVAWGYGDVGHLWVVRQGFVLDFDSLAQVFWGDAYLDAVGGVYPVQVCGIDSGGHRTAEVYDFCRAHRGLIFPTKGASARMAEATKFSTIEYYPGTGKRRAIPGGIQLLWINTQYFKDSLSARLEVAAEDPGAIRFDSELTNSEAAHFVSEFVNEKGDWDCKNGDPNHLWDCSVGNFALWDRKGVRYMKRPEMKAKEEAPVVAEMAVKASWVRPGGGSGWFNR